MLGITLNSRAYDGKQFARISARIVQIARHCEQVLLNLAGIEARACQRQIFGGTGCAAGGMMIACLFAGQALSVLSLQRDIFRETVVSLQRDVPAEIPVIVDSREMMLAAEGGIAVVGHNVSQQPILCNRRVFGGADK